jgi:hypothetical protein
VPEQREGLSIELSQEQVERVLASASGEGSLSLALSGLPQAREALAGAQRHAEDARLSRSATHTPANTGSPMPAENDTTRAAPSERRATPPDASAYRDPEARPYAAGASPHAARVCRGAPADLRMTGIASWPFRVPRHTQRTPRCPALRCGRAV